MWTSNKGNSLVLLVVGVDALALLVGCGRDKAEPGQAVAQASASVAPAPPPAPAPPASSAPQPEAPPPATLVEAIEAVRPLLADSSNAFAEGGAPGSRRFAELWTRQGYGWAELQALPETTYGKVRKDADSESGKRLCLSGTVAQIQAIKLGTGRAYAAHLSLGEDESKVVTVVAIGSTGDIEDEAWARFCGVVTGRHAFDNTAGRVTHGVFAVGMFDLPANKAAPKSSAK